MRGQTAQPRSGAKHQTITFCVHTSRMTGVDEKTTSQAPITFNERRFATLFREILFRKRQLQHQ